MILREQVKDEKSENEGTKNTKAYKFHTFTLCNSMHVTRVLGSRDTMMNKQYFPYLWFVSIRYCCIQEE